MRISDWSSDVCSSICSAVCGLEHGRGDRLGQARAVESDAQVLTRVLSARVLAPGRAPLRTPGEYPELRCPFAVPVIVREIGRASCRERVCPYVLFSVVAGTFKKTIT